MPRRKTMSKKGLLVLGIIFLVNTKAAALSKPTRDFDSVNATSGASGSLQENEGPVITRSDDEIDLRLYEPSTTTPNQFAFGYGYGSAPRIRRRQWTNRTFDEFMEYGIQHMAEPRISMLWRVLTTRLFKTGNAISGPITSMANRVNKVVMWLAKALFAVMWKQTKNVVLPNADQTLVKLARGNIFPERLNKIMMSIHSIYEMLKILGFFKPT